MEAIAKDLAEVVIWAPDVLIGVNAALRETAPDVEAGNGVVHDLTVYLIQALIGNGNIQYITKDVPDRVKTPTIGTLPVPESWIITEKYLNETDFRAGKITKFEKPKTITPYFADTYSPRWRKRKGKWYLGFHHGMDINLGTGFDDYGIPVYATHDGVAEYFEWRDGAGNFIRITSEDGTTRTRYLHLSRFESKKHNVKKGDVIGYIGASAGIDPAGTASHLHYEIMKVIGGTFESMNPQSPAGGIDLIDPVTPLESWPSIKKRPEDFGPGDTPPKPK